MVELIDLGGYVEEDQPVYPGHAKTAIWTQQTHEEAGFARERAVDGDPPKSVERSFSAYEEGSAEYHPLFRTIQMDEHGPTHIDALNHLQPGHEQSIDEMGLEWFYGPAVGLDVSHLTPDEYIEVDDLEASLDEYGVEIQSGDHVTLHTGHHAENYSVSDLEKKWRSVHRNAGQNGEAAVWHATRGVKEVGVDPPELDHTQAISTGSYPARDA
jgi:kynurenine formamidase